MKSPEHPGRRASLAWAHRQLRAAGVVTLGLVVAAGPARAQQEGQAPVASQRPAWLLEPSVSLRETVTSNVRLSSVGSMDAVSEITPQIRLMGRTGRLQGSLDYALTGRLYARNSDENNLQQALSATGRAELVDRWAFLDVVASISRRATGALAAPAADSALLDAGASDVATLQVSPSLQGSVGDWFDYQARLGWSGTRTKDSPADSYSNTAELRLSAPGSAVRRWAWSLGLSHQASRFNDAAQTEGDRLDLALLYALTPELRLSLRAGHESSDAQTGERESASLWGAALRWLPSPRTSAELTADHRYFGHSHSAKLEHRMARFAVSFVDSRDVSTDAAQGGTALRNAFDVLLDLVPSSVTDPLQRAAVVDAALQRSGLNRGSVVGGGFLTTGVSLQRRQNLTLAYSGPRTTTLVSAFTGRVEALNAAQAILPGLSAGSNARQRGASLAISHRLTPQSSLSLETAYTASRTSGTEPEGSTSTRSITGSWTLQLPQQAVLSMSGRRVLSDIAGGAYNETAVIANLIKRF